MGVKVKSGYWKVAVAWMQAQKCGFFTGAGVYKKMSAR
ncbi:hypothetical protein ACZ87_03351 [Candidatus Erwinia dacicola]|uniref:Uncharacterized protein n=1 Tax=Candidatus Erwinia dacicola TaxID=252393 RepID=A0A328TKL3_9GAMM|nr:hypothetical protein ACZ87_03351 [Candidatus Erwinia dacicola]